MCRGRFRMICGGIAQMAERLVRIQKVRGSIALISILSVFHSLAQVCKAFWLTI